MGQSCIEKNVCELEIQSKESFGEVELHGSEI